MKLRNLSSNAFRLESGTVAPGDVGTCTPAEYHLLANQQKIAELARDTAAPAPAPKAKPKTVAKAHPKPAAK